MRTLVLLTSLLLGAWPVLAQPVRSPPRGDAERSQLLDVVRQVAPRLGIRERIEFRDVVVRVSGDWAFVRAVPTRPGGAALRHCERSNPELPGDPDINAVLSRYRGQWTVIEQHVCLTDWPFIANTYGAAYNAVMEFQAAPLRFPRSTQIAHTDDGFVSLRSAPSLQRGERLARMPERSAVIVTGCLQDIDRIEGKWDRWCSVRFGARTGWAPLKLLGLLY